MRRWDLVQEKFNGKFDVEPEVWVFIEYGKILERTMESSTEVVSMLNHMTSGVEDVTTSLNKDLEKLRISNNVDLANVTPDKV